MFKRKGVAKSNGGDPAASSGGSRQFDLSPNQVTLLQLGVAGLVVVIALNMAGPLAQRMAHLPILGIVNPPVLEMAAVDNPMALPAAIAAPANPDRVQAVDLSRLDEIFLPPVKTEVEVDLKAKSEEMINAALSVMRVSAVATGGAFVDGVFVRSGASTGVSIPVEGGAPVEIFVYAAGDRVTLQAGEHKRVVVIE